MAHQFDDFHDIDTVRSEIAALQKFNIDQRAKRGTVDKGINFYHPKKIEMTVSEIRTESPTSKSIRMVSDSGYLPPFLAGQYINVAVDVNGTRTSRAYSLTSSPNQRGYYEITVRSKKDGFVSGYLLEDLKVGDKLTTSSPEGQFIYNPVVHGKNLVFIAGGCGITPFKCMVQNFYERNDLDLNIHLVYGCANSNDVIFDEDFKALEDKYSSFNYHLVISDEPDYEGHKGFITKELIESLVDDMDGRRFYLCGPEIMYNFVIPEILKLGVSIHDVRREVQTPPADPTRLPNWPEGVTSDTTFTVKISDGRSIEVSAVEPLMNSLERHKIIVPALCRAGECSLCRTKLVSGQVYHPDSVRLRRSDKEYGYIHPCVAYPISDLEIVLHK